MTSVLWAAFGISIGAAVLHAALGLTRPLDRTYLSFACIMMLLAAYVYFEWVLYRATTSTEAVEALRHQVIVAHGFMGFVLLFVPAYTGVRISRPVSFVYWLGLAVLFVANVEAPYGVWLSGPPQLVHSTFRGEAYSAVIAPPLGPWQYAHTAYVLALVGLAFRCAIIAYRRGERRRGVSLAVALLVVILHHLTDVVRDAVGGGWPYVAEFGLVTWGMIMSIQLAIDFRAAEQRLYATLVRSEQHAAALVRLVEASVNVRDKLNTPLQTLELGLTMYKPRGAKDEQTLAELQRAVGELTRLGRAIEQTTTEQAPAPPERSR